MKAVPTAVFGARPTKRMRAGTVKLPPPMPVSPTASATTNPMTKSIPTPRRSILDVQPAFGLIETRPAPRAGIFSGLHRPRAVSAADARVIPIVKRVVRHVVFADVVPNLRPIPIRERIQLYQAKLG